MKQKLNRGLKLLRRKGVVTLCNTVVTKGSMKMKPAHCFNTPSLAQIEITTYCNLRCSTCKEFTDKFGSEADIFKHLDMGKFNEILNKLPYITRVRLNGVGEPLLHPNILEMIYEAHSRGLETEFFSNGTMFREEISKELIKSGINTILFSIDGASKDTFERIRKGAKFEEVTQNIKKFVELKKKMGSETPKIVVMTTLSTDNILEVPGIVELVYSLGVKKMVVKQMIPFVEELEKKFVTQGEHESIRRAMEIARKLGVSFNVGVFAKKMAHEPSASKILNCTWPWSATYITVDGWVTPCCNIYDPKILNFGNIFETDFSVIWGSKKLEKFRCSVKKGDSKVCYAACVI